MRIFFPTRILRAATGTVKDTPNWSHTLHLPRSSFPPAPSASKLVEYRTRCADELYEWQRVHRPATSQATLEQHDFVLHDGPPYANGAVHIGHALNKITKDLIIRTELSRGRRVKYQPGWDCHGLPIELKALQQQSKPKKAARSLKDDAQKETVAAQGKQLSDKEIRAAARSLAHGAVNDQRREFREWAVMGEWEKPYLTMDQSFELTQLQVFRHMVKNGLIHRANMPVYWSPSSRSALAESELEYDDNHKCTAAFVKMPLVNGVKLDGAKVQPTHALIWTTTPWTLPANRAIAVGPQMLYGIYQVVRGDGSQNGESFLVAEARRDHVQSFLSDGSQLELIQGGFTGEALAACGLSYCNIFDEQTSKIYAAEFVTDSSGTGLVHMAPGHGVEDYQVCMKNGLHTTFAPVNDDGRFTPDVAPALVNQALLPRLAVETKGAEQVLAILQAPAEHLQPTASQYGATDLVFATHTLVHKNPIDWRTKKPVIVRATAQWFADVSKVNTQALEALESVTFIPETGKNRLRAFVQGRTQWCISRQRAWGVPIPVLYNKITDEENYTDEVIEHLIKTIGERGTDAWFVDAADDPAYIPESLDKSHWIRKRDTMDVWFDSGSSWMLMEPRNHDRIADVYLEGSDQHRGWFQSSLLTKVATASPTQTATAPYKKLITHGFTLDGSGKKMSKSLGNVISPAEVIAGTLPGMSKGKKASLGPDLLRLWVASCDYTRDVSVSQQGFQTAQQALNKLRITFRYLLGVLQDYQQQPLLRQNLHVQDCIILSQLSKRSLIVFDAFSKYKFFEGIKEINHFVNTDLSAFYLEAVKDTLYAGLSSQRQRTQTVLHTIMTELIRWLAPVTPHLIEEIWDVLPIQLKQRDHPLQVAWDKPYQFCAYEDLVSIDRSLAFFQAISTAVKSAQEQARNDGNVGSGLACHVELHFESEDRWQQGGFSIDELRNALVLSTLTVHTRASRPDPSSAELGSWRYEAEIVSEDDKSAKAVILPPVTDKCPRCWQYTSKQPDELCGRCQQAVQELNGQSA